MDVAITGSSGLIGSALAASLRASGHRVRPVVRRAPSGPDEIAMDDLDLTGVDAVVHLAGEGIAEKRWDAEQKRRILESRTVGTRRVAEAVAACEPKPVLLSGSAVGIYGDTGDDVATEDSPAGTGFLADVCVQWEAAARPAVDAGARVAFLRTGIVLTPRGGALKQMLPLFKLGLGGRLGTGQQWMSWITLDDEVAAITHLLTAGVSGPVNLTAPNPVRQGDFAKTLGRVLHRPVLVPTPSFGPRLLLGRELAESLIKEGQRAIPSALATSGFTHADPDLEPALKRTLSR